MEDKAEMEPKIDPDKHYQTERYNFCRQRQMNNKNPNSLSLIFLDLHNFINDTNMEVKGTVGN